MKLTTFAKSDKQEALSRIIADLRELINTRQLRSGDKLPSERMLAEKLAVSRRQIREAINTLEYYELVKSIPQSGTFIANIGPVALNGMMDDILRLREHDFKSLVDTRVLLELKSVELAAKRRTEEELALIGIALDNYRKKVINREDALEEDLLFHLAIARASGNSTMNAVMLQIIPKIISIYERNRVCDDETLIVGLGMHELIFEAIRSKDAPRAVESMRSHFGALIDFCNKFAENENES